MRSGYCECGCGGRTTLAKKTRTSRGDVAGHPVRYKLHHNKKNKPTSSMYRQVKHGGRVTTLHRVRAERALGRPLPKGAVVHHADGSKDDDAPLVICQDERYHKLLHMRMRVKAAGGNPNTDKVCTSCGVAKAKSEFWKHKGYGDGLSQRCRDCSSDANRRYRSTAA